MKRYLNLIILGMISLPLIAQDAPTPEFGWKKEAVGGLNLTQTSFDNWTAGGENSLAWQVNFNFKVVNDLEKTNWATSGKLAYGSIKQNKGDARKSVDEIKLESIYKYKLGTYVNPYTAFNAHTQLTATYSYATDPRTQISAFMDPGYFRESIGVGYQLEETVKTRLGLSFKQTITSDYPVPYADDPETAEIEKTRSEVGMESVTDLNLILAENTKLTSKLELFTAFQGFDATDVDWDNTLTTKINEYFNMNFNVKLLYDKDLSARRQINQSLAFGLTYTFL